MRSPTVKELFRHPSLMLAFGFGTGLSRIAPGTIGTFVGVGLVFVADSLALISYMAVTAAALALGI